MPKAKNGRGNRNQDSRRNSPRIAISPSVVQKLDAIATLENKSRADIVEDLIEEQFALIEVHNEIHS